MKTIAFSISLVFIYLATSLRAQVGNTDVATQKMQIVKAIINVILKDPEFVSLQAKQQMRILIIVYDMLEQHFKTQQEANRLKRSGKLIYFSYKLK